MGVTDIIICTFTKRSLFVQYSGKGFRFTVVKGNKRESCENHELSRNCNSDPLRCRKSQVPASS